MSLSIEHTGVFTTVFLSSSVTGDTVLDRCPFVACRRIVDHNVRDQDRTQRTAAARVDLLGKPGQLLGVGDLVDAVHLFRLFGGCTVPCAGPRHGDVDAEIGLGDGKLSLGGFIAGGGDGICVFARVQAVLAVLARRADGIAGLDLDGIAGDLLAALLVHYVEPDSACLCGGEFNGVQLAPGLQRTGSVGTAGGGDGVGIACAGGQQEDILLPCRGLCGRRQRDHCVFGRHIKRRNGLCARLPHQHRRTRTKRAERGSKLCCETGSVDVRRGEGGCSLVRIFSCIVIIAVFDAASATTKNCAHIARCSDRACIITIRKTGTAIIANNAAYLFAFCCIGNNIARIIAVSYFCCTRSSNTASLAPIACTRNSTTVVARIDFAFVGCTADAANCARIITGYITGIRAADQLAVSI